MDKLFEFLRLNPIVLFVLGAWLIGTIGNVLQARRKAKSQERRGERRQQRHAQPIGHDTQTMPAPRGPAAQPNETVAVPGRSQDAMSTTTPQPAQQPQPQARPDSAEQVAREMRRILGLEPKPEPRVERPIPTPARVPEPEYDETRPRGAVGSGVDPHVGDSMRARHLEWDRQAQQRSKQREDRARKARAQFGTLGGRVTEQRRHTRSASRFSLDDLRTAIVLNEILSPPVSLRPHDERRP